LGQDKENQSKIILGKARTQVHMPLSVKKCGECKRGTHTLESKRFTMFQIYGSRFKGLNLVQIGFYLDH
jgi:hypothetical protein